MNSNTHIALCDTQMFAHIPNFVYLAPTSVEEFNQMFKYATTQKEHPIGIKTPLNLPFTGEIDKTDYSILNKNKIENSGTKIAIFAVGILLPIAQKLAKKVKDELNFDITVVNPKFLTGLDTELLEKLKKNHNLVLTIEDGEVFGGYGQLIASYYGESNIKVKNFGISKYFHSDFNPVALLNENGISVENLFNYIKNFLKN